MRDAVLQKTQKRVLDELYQHTTPAPASTTEARLLFAAAIYATGGLTPGAT